MIPGMENISSSKGNKITQLNIFSVTDKNNEYFIWNSDKIKYSKKCNFIIDGLSMAKRDLVNDKQNIFSVIYLL